MANIPKFFKEETKESRMLLPLLPLRDIVVFPHMVAPLFVGRTKSVNALADAMRLITIASVFNDEKRIRLIAERGISR